jgi:hypothetical protein
MRRKILATLVVTLGLTAAEPASAQLGAAMPTGMAHWLVQTRARPGVRWRAYARTRHRARAYAIAARIRTTGYQARVVYRAGYSNGLGYAYGYGYGRRYYGRSYRGGYRRGPNYYAARSMIVPGMAATSVLNRNQTRPATAPSRLVQQAQAASRRATMAGRRPTMLAHGGGSVHPVMGVAAVRRASRPAIHARGPAGIGRGGMPSAARMYNGGGVPAAFRMPRPNTAGYHGAAYHAAAHLGGGGHPGGMGHGGGGGGGHHGGGHR